MRYIFYKKRNTNKYRCDSNDKNNIDDGDGDNIGHYIYFDNDNYADDCSTNDNNYNNDSKDNYTIENNYSRSL